MQSDKPGRVPPAASRLLRRFARRPVVEAADASLAGTDAVIDAVIDAVRAAHGETRAAVEAVVRNEAEARRRAGADMARILSDQSAALDDTTEIVGRILAGLVADVAALRQEIDQLHDTLAAASGVRPDGTIEPGRAATR